MKYLRKAIRWGCDCGLQMHCGVCPCCKDPK